MSDAQWAAVIWDRIQLHVDLTMGRREWLIATHCSLLVAYVLWTTEMRTKSDLPLASWWDEFVNRERGGE